MSTDTDKRQRFPLPWWALALILLGVSGGVSSVGRVIAAPSADANLEARIRGLEVQEQNLKERLERMDNKLDLVLEKLRGR